MGGRILVADSVATNRIALAAILKRGRYNVSMCATALDALQMARAAPPDLVFSASELPDMPGTRLTERLKAQAGMRDVPVLLMSRDREAGDVVSALAAGAEDVMPQPFNELALMARTRSLMRARETDRALEQHQSTVRGLGFSEQPPDFAPAARIALVARSRARGIALAAQLKREISQPVATLDLAGALAEADSGAPPDVYVIEATLEAPGDGLRLLADLRSRPGTRHAAIVIITDADDSMAVANALDLGANDLLLIGFHPQELALRLKTQLARKRRADLLRASVEDSMRLAVIDPLTGLYNRRYAYAHISQIDELARKTGRQYAVMLADIDRFKAINDTWGHAAGDAVLAEVAKRLRDNLRGIDMVARIGGEEFLMALPKTSDVDARMAAERLCALIARDPVRLPDTDQTVPVTISIGLAMSGAIGRLSLPVNSLIDKADRALYSAKADGRNQVTVSRSAA